MPDRTAALSLISVLALRFLAPPTTAFMLRHWAIALAAGRDGPLRYDWVDYERISRDAALAVVAAEDQLFPSHSGFDFKAISRVQAAYSRKIVAKRPVAVIVTVYGNAIHTMRP